MRKTVIAAPTLLAAAAATLAGCAGPDDTAAASGPDTEPARFSHGPLVGPTGDGEIGIVNRESRPNRPYPYGSLYVCVTGSEPVTIDSMAAEQTVGGCPSVGSVLPPSRARRSRWCRCARSATGTRPQRVTSSNRAAPTAAATTSAWSWFGRQQVTPPWRGSG